MNQILIENNSYKRRNSYFILYILSRNRKKISYITEELLISNIICSQQALKNIFMKGKNYIDVYLYMLTVRQKDVTYKYKC